METHVQGCGKPAAPLLLIPNPRNSHTCKRVTSCSCNVVVESTRDLWDRIFTQGYYADVMVHTNNGTIAAHGAILVSNSICFVIEIIDFSVSFDL